MTIEDDSMVLRRPARAVRPGWGEAARNIAEAGDDELAAEMHDYLRTRMAKKLGAVSPKTLSSTLRTLQEVFAE